MTNYLQFTTNMVTPSQNNKSIRLCIISYSAVIALMLYQPSNDSGLGTLFAMITMSVTAILFIFQILQGNFLIKKEAIILVALTIELTITTLLQTPEFFIYLEKVAALTLLTSLLSTSFIGEKEEFFLKNIFELTVIVNSIAIIIFCLTADRESYDIHSSIVIFNSEIDPNYIGIPLVAGSAFLLNDILTKRTFIKRFIFSCAFIIVLIAIIETSSRGNFLAFALGNTLILRNHLIKNNSSSAKSTIFIILTILTIIFIYFISPMFINNIDRMTNFEDDADNGRFDLWTSSINIWEKNLLLGGGFGSVLLSYGHASHSLFFEVLAEMGLLGLILLVWFLYLLFRHANSYNPLYGAIILALLLQSLFINTLDNRCFWAILGWTCLLPSTSNKQKNKAIYIYDRQNQKISKVFSTI